MVDSYQLEKLKCNKKLSYMKKEFNIEVLSLQNEKQLMLRVLQEKTDDKCIRQKEKGKMYNTGINLKHEER